MQTQLTKIIATVKDDCPIDKVMQLYNAWVDVIRINFTHATPESSKKLLEDINDSNKKGYTHLSTLLDTKGPDIRTGIRETPLQVKRNQVFNIHIDETKLTKDSDIFCDYPGIIKDVKPGQEIIIDSWLLLVEVKEIKKDHLIVKALNDAEIWSKRHINLPWVKVSLPAMIEKDRTDILFWIKMWISYVAASFIRTWENVKEIRNFLDKNWGKHIKIISKIENKEAIENLEDIVKKSDWIMVARWDLGIEMPIYELPVYQKKILDMCFQYWKPVIIATELMKSMVNNPFPTRAEVSDVYNSVIMRADAVMLSDETAVGKYPIKAVQYMEKIISEAEKTTTNKHKDFDIQTTDEAEVLKKALSRYALMLADEIHAKAVVAFSYSWNLARYLSALKPNIPVISFTEDFETHYSMGINFGVFSKKIRKFSKHMSEDQEIAIEALKEEKMIKKWDQIIIIWVRLYNWIRQPQIRVIPIV